MLKIVNIIESIISLCIYIFKEKKKHVAFQGNNIIIRLFDSNTLCKKKMEYYIYSGQENVGQGFYI